MRAIKYLGFFDFQDSKVPRHYSLACTNKMESIAEALIEAGFKVEIVSSAFGANQKFFIAPGETIKKSDLLSARYFPTIGGSGRIVRTIKRLLTGFFLMKFLLLGLKKDEPLIVYHCFGYRNLLILAKKIRKFKLILDVGEVYQDVVPMSAKARKWEHRTFEIADAYIFSTELLNKSINKNNKPYTIILGSYHVEPIVASPDNDGKIHVVYAGTFDPRKGGTAAASTAACLPDDYIVDICGFGLPDETESVKKAVEEINSKFPGKAKYHGTLKGKDYISLLQKCHIGLCPQFPDASFNATSFPSKILSYMANGLDVVTVDIPAIRESKVGPYLHYYNKQKPKYIAEAICSAKLRKTDPRAIIRHLYSDFVSEIGELINKVTEI